MVISVVESNSEIPIDATINKFNNHWNPKSATDIPVNATKRSFAERHQFWRYF
jgi:hypothetical protein